MSNSYLQQLNSTLDGVVAKLAAKGIQAHRLTFGGEGPKPTQKSRVPTDARSEFLANRAMGDWAERMLSAAIVAALPEWKVVQYGNTDAIAAGHPDFKTRYLAGLEETRLVGKRPDLLVFPKSVAVDGNLSERSHTEIESLVKQASAAIEVRSSKFEA
ncbi:MAG TPA: AccI family restriction endonuclease, partial [Candidatus Paceibacterota bacterium]|nr:AccI family restriction endonuclease [Candidatus Paceibacterota bacterium]